jgi:hypothetical protein
MFIMYVYANLIKRRLLSHQNYVGLDKMCKFASLDRWSSSICHTSTAEIYCPLNFLGSLVSHNSHLGRQIQNHNNFH